MLSRDVSLCVVEEEMIYGELVVFDGSGYYVILIFGYLMMYFLNC